jgi:hypothetical protein
VLIPYSLRGRIFATSFSPTVRLSELAGFVAWLREPQPGVLLLEQCEAKRSESTINAILSAVASFYEFHQRDGAVGTIPLMTSGRRAFCSSAGTWI